MPPAAAHEAAASLEPEIIYSAAPLDRRIHSFSLIRLCCLSRPSFRAIGGRAPALPRSRCAFPSLPRHTVAMRRCTIVLVAPVLLLAVLCNARWDICQYCTPVPLRPALLASCCCSTRGAHQSTRGTVDASIMRSPCINPAPRCVLAAAFPSQPYTSLPPSISLLLRRRPALESRDSTVSTQAGQQGEVKCGGMAGVPVSRSVSGPSYRFCSLTNEPPALGRGRSFVSLPPAALDLWLLTSHTPLQTLPSSPPRQAGPPGAGFVHLTKHAAALAAVAVPLAPPTQPGRGCRQPLIGYNPLLLPVAGV